MSKKIARTLKVTTLATPSTPTLDALTAAYVAAITPGANFQYWLEGGVIDGCEHVNGLLHQLIDEGMAGKTRPDVPEDLHRRMREALPAQLWADWQALEEYHGERERVRADVLFEVGMRVGRVLAVGAR